MSSEKSELERIIINIVEEAIKKNERKITEDEIKEIIQHILPELDQLIAKQVKKHLSEILKALQKFVK